MSTLTSIARFLLVLGLTLVAASSTMPDDRIVRSLALTVHARNGDTQFVHLRILARPSFTFVPGNEAYSNFTTQLVLVKDARSGEVISTLRQSDSSFVDAYFYLPASSLDSRHRARLVLEPASPWFIARADALRPIQVVSTLATGTSERYLTYDLMFGKPDDLPFLGERLSYAEGPYQMGEGWFHNKFFRYGNNPSSFRLPLESGKRLFLRPAFFLSARTRLTLNGEEVAVFGHSVGSRFHQDFYRLPVTARGNEPQVLTLAKVAPFRATPTNLRQMAFAFHSIEIATPRGQGEPGIDLVDRLNARLDYRHGARARDALLTPTDAVASLAEYQGGAWLPARTLIPLPADARRVIDAVVLLDPILAKVANTAYSSGDVWLNAAAGAAMLLEARGYTVAYATPADLAQLSPRVIYVPSQPFYRNLLTPAILDRLAAAKATVIVEPSFSGEFLNNAAIEQATGVQILESAQPVFSDNLVIGDQPLPDALHSTPVLVVKPRDPAVIIEARLASDARPIAFSRPFGASHLATLAFPAAYHYYNYGQRSHAAVVDHLLRHADRPLVFGRSASRVRAYAIRQGRCEVDILIENNNVGSFHYYGFAEVQTVRPTPVPPPVARVELDGALFDDGRHWQLRARPPQNDRLANEVAGPAVLDRSARRPVLHDLPGDTLVTLFDEACRDAPLPSAARGANHQASTGPGR